MEQNVREHHLCVLIWFIFKLRHQPGSSETMQPAPSCAERVPHRPQTASRRKQCLNCWRFPTVIFALHSPKKRSPVLTSSGACLKIRINQVGDAPQLAYQCYFQNFPAKFYRLLKLWLGHAVHIKIIMCTTGVCTHTHTHSPSLSLSLPLSVMYIYIHPHD